MIFVTLGSQKFQFNRLLLEIDRLIDEKIICEGVYAQIGYSDYVPQNYKYKAFLDRNEFSEVIRSADIIITHGGTGVIINAVKQRKKVIAVPRKREYGEHVDDHQLQLLEQFKDLNLIYACKDCTELEKAVKEVRCREYKEYVSNTKTIIKDIEEYIDGEF